MTLIIELPDDQLTALMSQAHAQGVSPEQCATDLIKQALASSARKPLSARIRDLWAEMPAEVRETLPPDGASEHDHYIYGTPKTSR